RTFAGHTSQPTGRATAGGTQCLTKPRRPAAGNGGQLPGFFMPVRRRAAVSGADRDTGAQAGARTGYRYQKFHRTAQSWTTVAVAALARRTNGTVAEARIGLTNMGP